MTTYLVQKVITRESTVWPNGQAPKVERVPHYVLLYSTEIRQEALTICKYETRRTGEPCRIITENAWAQQKKGGDIIKGDGVIKAKTRQPSTARAGLVVATGTAQPRTAPARYYKQSTPKQLRTRTNKLYKLLKAIW